jgi:hypothetical protein
MIRAGRRVASEWGTRRAKVVGYGQVRKCLGRCLTAACSGRAGSDSLMKVNGRAADAGR